MRACVCEWECEALCLKGPINRSPFTVHHEGWKKGSSLNGCCGSHGCRCWSRAWWLCILPSSSSSSFSCSPFSAQPPSLRLPPPRFLHSLLLLQLLTALLALRLPCFLPSPSPPALLFARLWIMKFSVALQQFSHALQRKKKRFPTHIVVIRVCLYVRVLIASSVAAIRALCAGFWAHLMSCVQLCITLCVSVVYMHATYVGCGHSPLECNGSSDRDVSLHDDCEPPRCWLGLLTFYMRVSTLSWAAAAMTHNSNYRVRLSNHVASFWLVLSCLSHGVMWRNDVSFTGQKCSSFQFPVPPCHLCVSCGKPLTCALFFVSHNHITPQFLLHIYHFILPPPPPLWFLCPQSALGTEPVCRA